MSTAPGAEPGAAAGAVTPPGRMTPERWARVHALFSDAVERDAAGRAALLDAACRGDAALRHEVESLLAAADGAGDFLEAPAASAAFPARPDTPEDDGSALALRLTTALADRYAVERELGRGGMATVYLARDLRHRRPVALKVLRADLAAALGARRFLREIETAANLSHPHILPLFDSGEAGGMLFYAMPYVAGESLRERLRRRADKGGAGLPRAEAVRIARELARALEYAHRRGVVHRDVKPENVLLDEGGHAWLADFGIARPAAPGAGGDVTAVGAVIGTARYMSPEQVAGETVDGRSDVYALGCVLYEMLVGDLPRASGARASGTATALGPALAGVVATATARVPADRYADARAFEEALARAADADSADDAAGGRELPRPVRRRRRAATAFAGVAAAGALALAWRAKPPDAPALDRNRVAVYPLVVSGGPAAAHTVGEDVAAMIGHALDGAGPLRWVDGWRLLGAAQRDDVRALAPDEAGALARSKRCAYYVSGRVVYRGDSADVLLELTDVAGDSVVARGRVTGAARDAWRSGLRSMNALLPALLPGGSARDLAAGWQDRDPGAVANFLLGEAAFRRARAGEALAHYHTAVRADSTFALAAVRGAQAAAWQHRPDESAALVKRALAYPLPPPYTHFARGYAAYLEGRADSAAAEFRRAVALDDDMAAAWMQLGETYTHLLPVAGPVDSLADAAFAEARWRDTAAAHVLLHPIERLLRRGRAAEAAPLVRRFLAAGPDSTLAEQVRIMDACARRGPAGVDWAAAVGARPFAVLSAAQAFGVAGEHLPCAAAGYAAILDADTVDADATDRRGSALVGFVGVLVAQGRADSVPTRVATAVARGDGGTSHLLLAAPLAPALRAPAAAVARDDAARFGEQYTRCPYAQRSWILTIYEAWRGRGATAAAAARALAARADSGGPQDRNIARAAAAHALLAQGDTNRAITAFAAAIATPEPDDSPLAWQTAPARGATRLAYAELLLARGAYAHARAVADVFDSAEPASYVLYIPASLAVRARAADAMKDAAGAAAYRARLAGLARNTRVAARFRLARTSPRLPG